MRIGLVASVPMILPVRHLRFDIRYGGNVNAVDKERLKESVGPGRGFPFGLPRADNAN